MVLLEGGLGRRVLVARPSTEVLEEPHRQNPGQLMSYKGINSILPSAEQVHEAAGWRRPSPSIALLILILDLL